MPRLLACPSCSAHVKVDATECPHCGGSVRTCRALPLGAGVVLMGLTLSGCPADDGAESETMASTPATTADTTGMQAETTSSGSTQDVDGSTFESAAAYGTPDTGVDSLPDDTGTTGSTGSTGDAGTDTDTDTGGTTLEPEYGVPTTSG
jgi:hypothetical protein